MTLNRREHKRYQVDVTAEVDIGGETLVGETRDISLGGLSISVDSQVQEDSIIDLSLILTQDGIEDPNEDPFEAQAKVIWIAPSDLGKNIIGLRFTQLKESQQIHLERFIVALTDQEPIE